MGVWLFPSFPGVNVKYLPSELFLDHLVGRLDGLHSPQSSACQPWSVPVSKHLFLPGFMLCICSLTSDESQNTHYKLRMLCQNRMFYASHVCLHSLTFPNVLSTRPFPYSWANSPHITQKLECHQHCASIALIFTPHIMGSQTPRLREPHFRYLWFILY